jgi:tetratricopeptide (TPR) repeat protein
MSFVFKNRTPAQLSDGVWNALPDNIRGHVRETMSKLQDLGESPDKEVASGALAVAGMLQFMLMHDPVGSEKSLRRAVALDPSREGAWEMLAGVLADREKWDELAPVCETSVKLNNSVHNRLVLAKARWNLNQFDKAEQQVQAALRLEPRSSTAHLALTALKLRRDDPQSLKEAGQLLEKARQLIGDSPSNTERIDFPLLVGFYFGLTDHPALARGMFNKILEGDHDNTEAKAALAALPDAPAEKE